MRLMENVARAAPNFKGFSRWALEVTFIDCATLYEHGGELQSPLTDTQWDALGKYLANRPQFTSPYFKHSITDMVGLKRKVSAIYINWNAGLGAASLHFWNIR